MTERPTGTVTFVCIDFPTSVALWEHHPALMAATLVRVRTLLHETIRAHRGTAFKTFGDTSSAVFVHAFDAIAAVVTCARTLQQEERAGAAVPPRMAVHTGITEIYADEYFGLALSRTARLLAVGHPGQILLSRATQELVQDHLPSGMMLRDLGTHRLKDLTRPEHIFQVILPDHTTDFPPLHTVDQRPTNLPIQSTPFIGRAQEVTAVCALLRQPSVRLLTLTGTGGTGKTRLSLQIAAELLDQFPDGVYIVTLASIHDSSLVLTTIARTLGLSDEGSRPIRDLLHDYVRDKQLLLLLDNFEQVVAAANAIADLLDSAPHLTILVTSRVLLQLYEEREYRVAPLALPDLQQVLSTQHLTQYEAVTLFVMRAQAANVDFHITNANAPAIAEICVRLDGLPLALELAAARVKILPPQALLARLSNRLALLTSTTRNVPARQQTLRGAIDWSYNLLEPYEQELFARLSVFVGGCTLEAATAICNFQEDIPGEMLDVLSSLVDKSLLQQRIDSNDAVRFVMLETLREYAHEQLVTHDAVETLREAHSTYFVSWVDTITDEMQGQQIITFNQLTEEYDNLRAVFAWILERGAWERGLALLRYLHEFWYIRGYLREGLHWSDTILLRSPHLQTTLPYVNALLRFAELALQQGSTTHVAARLEHALALTRAQGYVKEEMMALYTLGILFNVQGDLRQARNSFEAALAMGHQLNMRTHIGVINTALGNLLLRMGEYAAARPIMEESLAIDREVNDLIGETVSLSNLAGLSLAEGNDIATVTFALQSLLLGHQLHYTTIIASVFEILAVIAIRRTDVQQAARLFGVADTLRQTTGTAREPVDEELFAPYLRTIQQAVASDSATASTWAEGQALTLDQAVAYAQALPLVAPPVPPAIAATSSARLGHPASLSSRELEVLRLVAQGLTDAEVAKHLVVSPRTINAHLVSIYSKLGVKSRAAATRFAVEHGLT